MVNDKVNRVIVAYEAYELVGIVERHDHPSATKFMRFLFIWEAKEVRYLLKKINKQIE